VEFYDTGAVVWFAKIIEWEFIGFSVDKCLEQLQSVESLIRRDGMVSSTAHRFLIIAKKPINN
jgi:hypothetical protein